VIPQPPKPCLIGIAGPSCAGKTELAERLADRLSAPIVPLDCYYRELAHLSFEERARSNFDVPAALDEELLTRQLGQLARGEEIRMPVYDFTRHLRTADARPLRATGCVIVEGLFTLHWEEIRGLLDVKLFVAASEDACLRRRIERDVRERGRTVDSVIEQYRTTVGPMARQYILPTARYADVVLDGERSIEESLTAALECIRKAG
jgi:uridine kinase